MQGFLKKFFENEDIKKEDGSITHEYGDGSQSIIARIDIPEASISIFNELEKLEENLRRPIRVEKYIGSTLAETIDYIYEDKYMVEIKETAESEGNCISYLYSIEGEDDSKLIININKDGKIEKIIGKCDLVYEFLKKQIKNKPNEMLSPFLVHSIILEESLSDNDRIDRFVLPDCFNLGGNLTRISEQIRSQQHANDFIIAPFLYPARYGEREGHFQASILSSNSSAYRFNSLIGNKNADNFITQKGLFGEIITNDQNCLQKEDSNFCGLWTAAFCIEVNKCKNLAQVRASCNTGEIQINMVNRISRIVLGEKLVIEDINELKEELRIRYLKEFGDTKNILEKDYIENNLDAYIEQNFDYVKNNQTEKVIFVRKIDDSVNNFVNRDTILTICSKYLQNEHSITGYQLNPL